MPDLTCQQCRALLPWLVRDTLTPAETAEVQRHLAICDECHREFAQWQAISVAAGTDFSLIPTPSAEATARIIAATSRRLPRQNHHAPGEVPMTEQSSAGAAGEPANVAEIARSSRSPIPLVAAFVLGVLVVMLAGFGLHYFANNDGASPHPQTVNVPDFIGETVAQAKAQAAQVHLYLKINNVISAAPVGTIIHQNPGAGILITLPQQNLIDVDVSLGTRPDATAVP